MGRLQGFVGVEDRGSFLALSGILVFTLLYVLFTASRQVHPSSWVYTEALEDGWMLPEHDTSGWKPIGQLPLIEMGEKRKAYYRGVVELSGVVKPDIAIGGENRILSVYVNGVEVTGYKKSPTVGAVSPRGEDGVLSASLFKPGKNLVAVKIEGDVYRIINIITLETTARDSKLLLLFFATPLLLFILLDRKTLDSDKVAVLVFLILTLVFLKPLFQDFNYWGAWDWDGVEALNAIPKETMLKFLQIPLWNPYYSGGVPLLGDPQSMFISPLFPVILAFGVIAGLKIQVVLWYVIGLMGMYLLGKHFKLNTYGRYLMAFALVFSSWCSLRVMIGQFMTYCMPLIPWAFLFYLKSLEDRRYVVLSALTIAVMFYMGSIGLVVHVMVFLALYAVLTSVQRFQSNRTKKDAINPLATLLAIGLLFSALGAAKLLPAVEYMGDYPRLTGTDPALYNGYSPSSLYYALLGTQQTKWVKYPMTGGRADWDLFGAYVGPLVVLLAVLGILFYFRKQWPLVVIALFGLALTFGVDRSQMLLWDMLHKLPVFSSIRHPSRFISLSLFPITIFAGYMASRMEEKRRWLALVLTVLVFYNLLYVNTPTLSEAFTMTPPAITRTRFTQVADEPQGIIAYSDGYRHFLQNQGIVNGYGSLLFLSKAKPSSVPLGHPYYRGEVYLDSESGSASFRYFSPNRMIVDVNTENPDTLVVNQNYGRGWKSPGRGVYPKDGLIAVEVSPGDEEILLYYSPMSFKIGLTVTLLAILLAGRYLTLKKEKHAIKKYAKSLKDKKTVFWVTLIALVSLYGVDLIQASGFFA